MKTFFAYPSSQPDVIQSIRDAKKRLSKSRRDLELHLWEENDISGRPLTDPIFENIEQADFLIADITVRKARTVAQRAADLEEPLKRQQEARRGQQDQHGR
jgi:hypothetical protein